MNKRVIPCYVYSKGFAIHIGHYWHVSFSNSNCGNTNKYKNVEYLANFI